MVSVPSVELQIGASPLLLDHDHRTGKVRALLCNRCNRVLGLAEDSPELLSKMSNYLKEHETED